MKVIITSPPKYPKFRKVHSEHYSFDHAVHIKIPNPMYY